MVTVEAFLAIPDDGTSRELIRGRVQERGPAIHGRPHARSMASITYALATWRDARPAPRGRVLCGECGFLLQRREVSLVGIDVAYVSAEHLTATSTDASFFDGPPVLAVEILEETDTAEGIAEKVNLYHDFGANVWIADPLLRTIGVHRPGHPPETFNERQELLGEPYLPGYLVTASLTAAP